MIKKMLTRGTVLVGALIAANAVIEKLERAELKRKEDKSKIVIDLTEKDDNISDEDVQEALAKELSLES